MRLFSRGCQSREDAYLAVAGGLRVRERIALEAHAATCAECADALRNGRPVDTALRGAFSPLRERRTIIAPGRVRLAVGRSIAAPTPWLMAARFFGRLAEVTVMVGVTVFAVGNPLETSAPPSSPITSTYSVVQEYFRAQPPTNEIDYLRWLRRTKIDDSRTVSDTTTRLPMGGRFDGEPPEILEVPGASPR